LFVVKAKILPRRDINERIKSFQKHAVVHDTLRFGFTGTTTRSPSWAIANSIYHSICRALSHFIERIIPAGMDSIQHCGFYPPLHSSSILFLRVWILSNIVDSIHRSIRRAYCT
jgi:hypothetical protein